MVSLHLFFAGYFVCSNTLVIVVARKLRMQGGRAPVSVLIEQNASNESLSEQVKYELMDLPFDTDLLNITNLPFFVRHYPDEGTARARISRQKPLIWIHIHKAAGTLMCELAQIAGENVVYPNANCNWEPRDMYGASGSPGLGPSCSDRATYFATNGYTYGQIEREIWPSDQCWNDFDYGVMLRDPIDLIHSNLNYNLRFYNGMGRAAFDELRRRMESGASHTPKQTEWLFLDNIQTRLLTNSLGVAPGQIDETHVQAAKELLNNFRVVAVLEDLSNTGFAVFERIGWGEEMGYHIGHKANRISDDPLTFTVEEVEWLRDINKHDISLYESFHGQSLVRATLVEGKLDEGKLDEDKLATWQKIAPWGKLDKSSVSTT